MLVLLSWSKSHPMAHSWPRSHPSGHCTFFPALGCPEDQRQPLPGNHIIPGAMPLPGTQRAHRGHSLPTVLTAPHPGSCLDLSRADLSSHAPGGSGFPDTPDADVAMGRGPTEAAPVLSLVPHRGIACPDIKILPGAPGWLSQLSV